jgi:hypothetical protein
VCHNVNRNFFMGLQKRKHRNYQQHQVDKNHLTQLCYGCLLHGGISILDCMYVVYVVQFIKFILSSSVNWLHQVTRFGECFAEQTFASKLYLETIFENILTNEREGSRMLKNCINEEQVHPCVIDSPNHPPPRYKSQGHPGC